MQASALSSQPAIAPPPMSKDSLTASLAARSLAAQSIALTGEYAKLQLKGVSFAGLVDWLDVQRRDYRIAVQEASFTAQSPEGQVDAILTLHQGQGRP
jgi:general secretion pathway protein M